MLQPFGQEDHSSFRNKIDFLFKLAVIYRFSAQIITKNDLSSHTLITA